MSKINKHSMRKPEDPVCKLEHLVQCQQKSEKQGGPICKARGSRQEQESDTIFCIDYILGQNDRINMFPQKIGDTQLIKKIQSFYFYLQTLLVLIKSNN